MTTRRYSAAECIATRYGWDIADVREMAYCPRKYSSPVYTMFNGYACCPAAGKKPPSTWDWQPDWKPDGEAFGRTVYFAESCR